MFKISFIGFGYKEIFKLRGGFAYEDGIFNADERTSALTGLTGGFSIDLPMSKNNDNKFAVDYSYRASNPFGGSHGIGVRILVD